jgi:signal transduction histidine kinase
VTSQQVVRRPQWTLRRRITALCLLLATVLTFLAAGAAATAIANRGQLDNLLDNIGPMRNASNNLLASLVNQETSVRGYVLNGTEADLAPYAQGVKDQADQTALIERNPAVTPEIRAELSTVSSLAREWNDTVAQPAISAARAGDRQLATSLVGESARVRFDRIRDAVAVMQQTMQTLRDDSAISVKDTSSTLLFVLIVAAILVITGGAGLLILLQRTVISPLTDLAAQVRSVARGNYGQAISTPGPPELEFLARDVDSMRRQIASDLAEVERARQTIEAANLALEQQAAELTRSNRDLEQFAYVASHDLQEPLRKVASFCQLLQRRYSGQLDERADQYIAFAVNGAQRMQRLINDLLAFSRIGRSAAAFTDVDLDRLVAEAVTTLDATVEQTGAEVTWSDLPVIRGEEALLSTLFTNLIGNSVKFRRPDAPARVHISGRRVDDRWEISCVDNGIGIEREFADKVFVIFQRLHPRDAYPGTGIGLAVAKKIVEYHGGTIWIDSDHTDGAAIRFTLPLSAEPSSGEAAIPAVPAFAPPAPAAAGRGVAESGDVAGRGIGESARPKESVA